MKWLNPTKCFGDIQVKKCNDNPLDTRAKPIPSETKPAGTGIQSDLLQEKAASKLWSRPLQAVAFASRPQVAWASCVTPKITSDIPGASPSQRLAH